MSQAKLIQSLIKAAKNIKAACEIAEKMVVTKKNNVKEVKTSKAKKINRKVKYKS